MNKLSTASRTIIGISSLSLIATYFLPVWFIFLIAPQYPEGLTMNIWLDKITGQVDIINGLNHYIGMKHINTDMFPEFQYMIYIVAGFIVIGLLAALTGSRKVLLGMIILLIAGAGLAMYDFYQWGYDYGHNLDPKAAIQVPGLSYQPPLFGHKTLLNFDAYSYPDTGGWLIIAVSGILMIIYALEWKRASKAKKNTQSRISLGVPAAAALFLFSFSSCNTEPQPFKYGKDMCDDCNMTIMDPHFGGQVITKKGRVYKFDDVHCMVNFLSKKKIDQSEVKDLVFVNYENENDLIHDENAWFLTAPDLKSPMNSHTAAFSEKSKAEALSAQKPGALKQWNELYSSLQ